MIIAVPTSDLRTVGLQKHSRDRRLVRLWCFQSRRITPHSRDPVDVYAIGGSAHSECVIPLPGKRGDEVDFRMAAATCLPRP